MIKLVATETGVKKTYAGTSERFNVLDSVALGAREIGTVKTYTTEIVELGLYKEQLFTISTEDRLGRVITLGIEDVERIKATFSKSPNVQLYLLAHNLDNLCNNHENNEQKSITLTSKNGRLAKTFKHGDAVYLFLGYKVDGKFVADVQLKGDSLYQLIQ